jgi:3-hydroxyisobutyrate dehydrogenase
MEIGIAGIGKMGAAIAARLMEEGFKVSVWNRTRNKLKPLTDLGATACNTPADLLAASDIIISILTDEAAIKAVYLGPKGLLETAADGKLFIDMSTVRPESTVALAQAVREKKGIFVECPVGGTTKPARDGVLVGFVGGESKDVEMAMPVLSKLCRRIEHVGPVGSGASLKLAINLPLIVFWQVFGEAISLCDHLGIEPARLVELFSESAGGPNILKAKAAAAVAAMEGREIPGTFDIASMKKDLRAMCAEANTLGREMPVTQAALSCYERPESDALAHLEGANQSVYWARK